MAYSLNNAEIITEIGDHHIVVVDAGDIKRIKASDLGVGGGSGLRSYLAPTFNTLPGMAAFTVSDGAISAADTVRAFLLPAGDYTNMGVGIVPSTTATVADLRYAIYAAPGTDFQGGALIKDLGRIQRSSGAAVAVLKTAVDIGVQNNQFLLFQFAGTGSGNSKTVDVRGMSVAMPGTTGALAFGSTAWRGEATLTYPAGGAVPATAPAFTYGFGAATVAVQVFLTRV